LSDKDEYKNEEDSEEGDADKELETGGKGTVK